MKTLNMTVKKVWFDKIKSGEKTIEYRIIKPYWEVRLSKNPGHLILRNGYHKEAPALFCDIERINREHGIDTDLKINAMVFAIHLKNVREL